MKKFEIALTVLVIILISVMTIGVFGGELSRSQEKAREIKELKRENRQLELEVELRDDMFGKYADSISDTMLHDFYPEVKNLDSLRNRLKERYVIKLRKDQDGLCY